MTIQLQKVQFTYDNTSEKMHYTYGQYNCKKCNIRMTRELQNVQPTYDNTNAKSTIRV